MSDISSRNEINILKNGKLPLMVAPMDTVVNKENYQIFTNLGYIVCIPRTNPTNKKEYDDECFISYGLDELEIIIKNYGILPNRVLIDVANAHSIRVFNLAKKIKEIFDIELMVGNIANPETFRLYCEINVDFVRCGIGGGQVCTTSANTSIHYPMGSLIKECYDIKISNDSSTKIVADGGFKNFDEIFKAYNLGADFVMLGGIINKSIESCGDNYQYINGEYKKINYAESLERFNYGELVFKEYRGMSTKEVQKSWGKTNIKTSEGIKKYNKVEYTIKGWTENFESYLKSCMSYQNKKSIEDFIGNSEYVFITQNSFNRFNK